MFPNPFVMTFDPPSPIVGLTIPGVTKVTMEAVTSGAVITGTVGITVVGIVGTTVVVTVPVATRLGLGMILWLNY